MAELNKKFERNLMLYSGCIYCSHHFTAEEMDRATLFQNDIGNKMVYIQCKKCQTSSILTTVKQENAGLVGIITDLNDQDLKKISNKKITTDEVLELSDAINKI
jgi:hypothetical protein